MAKNKIPGKNGRADASQPIGVFDSGIGGLTAAACLLQRRHRVRVFEQSARLGEVGAGIQMSANAVKVLDSIGLRPALESFKAFRGREPSLDALLRHQGMA